MSGEVTATRTNPPTREGAIAVLSAVPKQRTLAEEIHGMLRRAILAGALLPGQRLVERAIASQTHTSKTPVREALLKLEQEGLVSVDPHLGTIVARLSLRQLENVVHVRVLLEVDALKLAVAKISAEATTEARQHLQQMRHLLQQRDWDAYWETHWGFHCVLFRASENPVITDILFDLMETSTRYSRICMEASQQKWLRDERYHEHLLEAVEQADMRGIEQIVGTMHDWFLSEIRAVVANSSGELAAYFE